MNRRPLTASWLFTAIAALALVVGGALWWVTRGPRTAETSATISISPSALWAAAFSDPAGRTHALGELQNHVVVINFWATWCVPCREEMPAFERLHKRWNARGVRFVGLANDDAIKVEQFGRQLGIGYPLWIGGENVGELSRRLGNRLGVLPHTVIVDPSGVVVDTRVGPYTEADLEAKLGLITSNLGDQRRTPGKT